MLNIQDFEKYGWELKRNNNGFVSFSKNEMVEDKSLILTYQTQGSLICIMTSRKLNKDYTFLIQTLRVDTPDELDWLLKALIFKGYSIYDFLQVAC